MDLFWSKRGVVACGTHAPLPDSETWHSDGWQQVPAWRRTRAQPLQCQFCNGRPYVRRIRATPEREHDADDTLQM